MRRPNKFLTMVLGAGVLVLLAAILLGEHMGDRVMVEAADNGSLTQTPLITPVPQPTDGPYGPDWKNTQTLAAAGDPHFPDPRVPPKPLPTPERTPSPSPTPTWTPNPNLPIWDQTKLPIPSPSATTFSDESTQASDKPEVTPFPGATPLT